VITFTEAASYAAVLAGEPLSVGGGADGRAVYSGFAAACADALLCFPDTFAAVEFVGWVCGQLLRGAALQGIVEAVYRNSRVHGNPLSWDQAVTAVDLVVAHYTPAFVNWPT